MSWRETSLTKLIGLRLPIVQAPTSGGPSTPRLAAAVSDAGGLGSLAGAMWSPEELRAAIRETRALTDAPFSVNLLAPLPPPGTERITEWAQLTGMDAGLPESPSWSFADQLAVVVAEEVRVFSFSFGIPPLDDFGGITIGTATTVEEAVALADAGVDAVLAQGFEAGGHRGTFLGPVDRALVGTLALVPQVVDAVDVPVIAAGGIADGRAVAAILALGADAAALGTAFIACPESGASDEHRIALRDETTISNVWTGRHARGRRSPWVDELERSGLDPPDFPLGRFYFPEPVLLMGQASRLARPLPAGDLVRTLEREVSATVDALGPG